MAWDINITDDFETWWLTLSAAEQKSIAVVVDQIAVGGPNLGRPLVDSIEQSRHSNMKELRIQHAGDPYRVFFAFDPRRQAVLLIGGNKTGDDRFYEKMVPLADSLYDAYLAGLRTEGLIQ